MRVLKCIRETKTKCTYCLDPATGILYKKEPIKEVSNKEVPSKVIKALLRGEGFIIEIDGDTAIRKNFYNKSREK